MMEPDFSRRIGRVMSTKAMIECTNTVRREFIETISQYNTFEELPETLQAFIVEAEKPIPSVVVK